MAQDTSPSQAALITLPTELLLIVCSHLDVRELKQVRLTNKRFTDIVTPPIFEEIHIALFDECLRKLERISRRPELACLVKRLVFHGDLLPPYTRKKYWEKHIDSRPTPRNVKDLLRQHASQVGGGPATFEYEPTQEQTNGLYETMPRHSLTKEEIDASWASYSKLQQEQEAWGLTQRIRLATAVCRLHKLEEAKVVKHECRLDSARDKPIWGRLYRSIRQSPEDWIMVKATRLEEYLPTYGDDGSGLSFLHSDWEGIVHTSDLLWSLAQRSKIDEASPLKSFQSFTGNPILWTLRDLNGLDETVRVNSYKPALTHLTRLNLSVTFLVEHTDVEFIPLPVVNFLSEATMLEELSFEFTEGNLLGAHEGGELMDGLDTLNDSDIRWAHLRKLWLSTVTTEASLCTFLKRHGSTLRDLSFKDVMLSEGRGTWASLLEKMPKLLPHLENVSFANLFDSTCDPRGYDLFDSEQEHPYYDAILQYCLHGGATVPHIYPEDWNEAHPQNRVPVSPFMIGDNDLEDEDGIIPAILGVDDDDEWEDEDSAMYSEDDDGYEYGLDGDFDDSDDSDAPPDMPGLTGGDGPAVWALMSRDTDDGGFWASMANA